MVRKIDVTVASLLPGGGSGELSSKALAASRRKPEANSKLSKSRIRLFPKVRAHLEYMRSIARKKMKNPGLTEEDKDVTAQAYASLCLVTLRQLRYHCMWAKLDGWRHGGVKRKVRVWNG